MKQLIVLFTFLFCGIAFAQKNVFPGENPEMLVGKKVKIAPSYLYHFYKSPSRARNYYKYSKDYEKIKDVELLVTAVKVNDGNFIFIEMESRETGKIYHGFEKDVPGSYELELVEDPNLPEDFFCKQYSGESPRFPFRKEYLIYKIDDRWIYLSFKMEDKEFYPDAHGIRLFFEDGTEKNVKGEIDYRPGTVEEGWIYTGTIKLTDEYKDLLKKKLLVNVELYVIKKPIAIGSAIEISKFINCLEKI